MNAFWQKIENGTAREMKPQVSMDPNHRYSNSLSGFMREKWKLANEAEEPARAHHVRIHKTAPISLSMDILQALSK